MRSQTDQRIYEGRSGLKPRERIGLKLKTDPKLHNDHTLVYDLFAGRLLYKSLGESVDALDAIYIHPDVKVVSFDNRMTRRPPTEAEIAAGTDPNKEVGGPRSGGYGDWRLLAKNSRNPPPQTSINAVTVELEGKLQATSKVDRIDHPILELARIIDSRGEPNDVEKAILKDIRRQTRALWTTTGPKPSYRRKSKQAGPRSSIAGLTASSHTNGMRPIPRSTGQSQPQRHHPSP